MQGKKENLNAGHRSRMRYKFQQYGPEAFLTHEILEMLLYYPIAYKNTNHISHQLLERFETIGGVISATREELSQVEGVGEQTALFLHLVKEAGNRVLYGDAVDRMQMDTYESLGRYATASVADETGPCVYAVFLNNRFEPIATELISKHMVYQKGFETRLIAKPALAYNAAMVSIISNRKTEPLMIKPLELDNTIRISCELDQLGIHMIEHYVVSGARYIGYVEKIPAQFSSRPDLPLAQFEKFFHRNKQKMTEEEEL